MCSLESNEDSFLEESPTCCCCVTGATIYTTEIPKVECRGDAPAKADKGCIVKEVFANFTV